MVTSAPICEQLAFASGGAESACAGLITAKERRPFNPNGDKKTVLNVEIFDDGTRPKNSTSKPYLLFIPGICESAETWTVQHLARSARGSQWRLAVLELEGHGLSSGKRAVCPSFPRLVEHVKEFVGHLMSGDNADVPFALCGASLGGVLAAYAADSITKSGQYEKNFIGIISIVPAVGVAPEAVPPTVIVGALRVLATVAPSAGFLTPVEDPSLYTCPSNSTRNFSGSWPLSTSKMLLDVTSTTVEKDQNDGRLLLDVPSLLVIAGERDHMIPYEAVKRFHDKAKSKDKDLVVIPKGDHGLMVESKHAKFANEKIFAWLGVRLQRMVLVDTVK